MYSATYLKFFDIIEKNIKINAQLHERFSQASSDDENKRGVRFGEEDENLETGGFEMEIEESDAKVGANVLKNSFEEIR